MATYNGAEHISEQVNSILLELNPDDEVIIIDDCSTDSTRLVLHSLQDHRIRVFLNETNLGYVKTFERALGLSRGHYIMLSDQDDLWIPGRVNKLLEALNGARLAVGNCEHFGGRPGYFQKIRLKPCDSQHRLRNVLGIVIGYRLHWGSAMALRRDLLPLALPFPSEMNESHDQWLALVANLDRSILYLDENVVRHRLHDVNVTPKRIRGFAQIMRARFQFLKNLTIVLRRITSVMVAQADRDQP